MHAPCCVMSTEPTASNDPPASSSAPPAGRSGWWQRFDALLVAVVAGFMAITGGYLAGKQALKNERSLQGQALNNERSLQQHQRAVDTRAAARVLDFELFDRARLALNAFGIASPHGDIKTPPVQDAW